MNNNNNNIFGNNNITPTPQPNTINGASSTLQTVNNVNNAYGANTVPSAQQTQVATPQNTYNTQLNNQMPGNAQNVMQINQNFGSSQVNDEELLRAYIGNNYDKITTRKFNFAAFFFNSLYMCYRKMFGYGILSFLAYLIVYNVINAIIPSISFVFAIGIFVAFGFITNKIYLSFAQKKIAIIKASNPQKSNEELKTICSAKGGTSVGKIFLGLLTQFGIALVVLIVMTIIGIGSAIGSFFNLDNWNITVNENGNTSNENIDSKDKKLVENVIVSGHGCFGSKCNVSIDDSNGNSTEYELSVSNSDLFVELGDYEDYIKLDIYYTQKGSTKTIVDYKIFLKSNNEDISSVKNVGELRDKIGLYSLGTHTDTLTLTEIGMTGFGWSDDDSYTYTSYKFVDSHNNEYEMKYINDNGSLNLVEGNKYSVTFEVTEGTFDYEYTIKSIN